MEEGLYHSLGGGGGEGGRGKGILNWGGGVGALEKRRGELKIIIEGLRFKGFFVIMTEGV